MTPINVNGFARLPRMSKVAKDVHQVHHQIVRRIALMIQITHYACDEGGAGPIGLGGIHTRK